MAFGLVNRATGFRPVLADILTVNATLVQPQVQNEEMTHLTQAGYTQIEKV